MGRAAWVLPVLTLAVLVLDAAHPREAAAQSVAVGWSQPLSATSPPAPPAARVWYGWQTFLAEGAAVSALVLLLVVLDQSAADATTIDLTLGAGLAAYLLAGPAVHVAHGRLGAALASLGLYVGIPAVSALAFGLLGGAAGWDNHAFGGFGAGALFVGLPVGVLAAILTDGLALAWDPVPRRQ